MSKQLLHRASCVGCLLLGGCIHHALLLLRRADGKCSLWLRGCINLMELLLLLLLRGAGSVNAQLWVWPRSSVKQGGSLGRAGHLRGCELRWMKMLHVRAI